MILEKSVAVVRSMAEEKFVVHVAVAATPGEFGANLSIVVVLSLIDRRSFVTFDVRNSRELFLLLAIPAHV